MPERFMRGIEAVNGIVWGPMGLGLLFGTGLLLTVRTGGFQLRRWGYWMRHTLGAILTDRSVTAHTAREEQAISQFQSLCTALASTIGTGNLVGVATAILSGGAGAVFWMWVMALLGMMTSYAENVLGIYYRRKDPAGGWRGGPMYYLRDGLGGKPGRVLAVLFAVFCALASFGIGNLSQLNSIAGNLQAAFGVPEAVTGAVLAAVSAVILLGGLKRVAAVAERLVPAMALLYIVGALTVVGVHITAVPAALAAIVKGAFGLRAAGGGIVGYGLSQAVSWGFKRGAFSNEAGLGSSVMVHAASNVKEPVQQGMWGIFEVFADTMVGVHPDGTGGADLRLCGSGHRAHLPPGRRAVRWLGRPLTPCLARWGQSSSQCASCCSPTPPRWAGAATAAKPWSISSARGLGHFTGCCSWR